MRLVLFVVLAVFMLIGCARDTVSTQDVENWQKAEGGQPEPSERGR